MITQAQMLGRIRLKNLKRLPDDDTYYCAEGSVPYMLYGIEPEHDHVLVTCHQCDTLMYESRMTTREPFVMVPHDLWYYVPYPVQFLRMHEEAVGKLSGLGDKTPYGRNTIRNYLRRLLDVRGQDFVKQYLDSARIHVNVYANTEEYALCNTM